MLEKVTTISGNFVVLESVTEGLKVILSIDWRRLHNCNKKQQKKFLYCSCL